MGKQSLDSFLDNFHIDDRLYRKARELLTYLTFSAYAAGVAACGKEPTGVDPPPPPPVGAPTMSIEASPNSGMAPLTSNVCATVIPGSNGGTIKDAWADYNGSGKRDDPDETIGAGKTCKTQTYTSTKTLTGIVTGGDNQPGNASADITIIQPVIVDTLAGIIFAMDSITGLKGAPLAAANVGLTGQPETATTAADGSYKLPLRKLKSQLGIADTLVISKDDTDLNKKFATYKTFLAHTLNSDKTKGDFVLIYAKDLEDINYYLRIGYDASKIPRSAPLSRLSTDSPFIFQMDTTAMDEAQKNHGINTLLSGILDSVTYEKLKSYPKTSGDIALVSSTPTGNNLKGKYIMSLGGGEVQEIHLESPNVVDGLMEKFSSTGTYSLRHIIALSAGFKEPKPGTDEYSKSILGGGSKVTPNLLRAARISYSGIRPPGSTAGPNLDGDVDPFPTSSASLMQSNTNAATALKANNPVKYNSRNNYNHRRH